MGTRAPRNGHGVPHLGILLAHAARDGHCVVRAVHLRGVLRVGYHTPDRAPRVSRHGVHSNERRCGRAIPAGR